MNVTAKKLIDRLLYEKNHKIRSGVYGELSRKIAYNSNKIEGSTLTEKQTASAHHDNYDMLVNLCKKEQDSTYKTISYFFDVEPENSNIL